MLKTSLIVNVLVVEYLNEQYGSSSFINSNESHEINNW